MFFCPIGPPASRKRFSSLEHIRQKIYFSNAPWSSRACAASRSAQSGRLFCAVPSSVRRRFYWECEKKKAAFPIFTSIWVAGCRAGGISSRHIVQVAIMGLDLD